MPADQKPFFPALAVALFRCSFGFVWGGGLFWMGGSISDVDNGVDGGFGLRATGLFIIAISLVGFVYLILKARAPALRGHKPADPGDLKFDPDAAIENYLRSRPPTGDATSLADPPSIRPVFGRRRTDSGSNGGDSPVE